MPRIISFLLVTITSSIIFNLLVPLASQTANESISNYVQFLEKKLLSNFIIGLPLFVLITFILFSIGYIIKKKINIISLNRVSSILLALSIGLLFYIFTFLFEHHLLSEKVVVGLATIISAIVGGLLYYELHIKRGNSQYSDNF